MPATANAGTDVIFAYGEATTTVALAGSGVGVDGLPIVGWLWTIQGKPSGSTPVFEDTGTITSNLETPVLMALPALGDVVISLVVIDEEGNVSETDYPSMPDDAVVVVGITTEFAALRVLSEWEMFWADAQAEWVVEIDRLTGEAQNLRTKAVRQHFMRSMGGSGSYAVSAVGPGFLVFPGGDVGAATFVVWARMTPLVASVASNAVVFDFSSDGTPSLQGSVDAYALDTELVDQTGSALADDHASVFNDGEWHHLAMVTISNSILVYIDAVFAFEIVPSGTYTALSPLLTLFADVGHANRLACDLAGPAVFDTQLDLGALFALKQAGRTHNLMYPLTDYSDQPVFYWHGPANDAGVIANEGTGAECALTLNGNVATFTQDDNTVWAAPTGLSLPAGAKLEGPTGLTLDFPGGLAGVFDGPVLLDAGSGQMALSAGDDSTWDFAGVDIDLTVGTLFITGNVAADDVLVAGDSIKPNAQYPNESKANSGTGEVAYTAVHSFGAMSVGDAIDIMLTHEMTAVADGGIRTARLKIAGVTVATDAGSITLGTTQFWGRVICTAANTFSFVGWHNFSSATSFVPDLIQGQTGVGSAFNISFTQQFSVGGGNNTTVLRTFFTKRANG